MTFREIIMTGGLNGFIFLSVWKKKPLEVLLRRVILNLIFQCVRVGHTGFQQCLPHSIKCLNPPRLQRHVVSGSSPQPVHFNVLSFFVWSQNVLVPVPCACSPAPLVTGRDPVQAPAGQLEWRKQPANQEQLLLFFQEQSEDFLVQNKWVSRLLPRLSQAHWLNKTNLSLLQFLNVRIIIL